MKPIGILIPLLFVAMQAVAEEPLRALKRICTLAYCRTSA
jgi:hypothetical protein